MPYLMRPVASALIFAVMCCVCESSANTIQTTTTIFSPSVVLWISTRTNPSKPLVFAILPTRGTSTRLQCCECMHCILDHTHKLTVCTFLLQCCACRCKRQLTWLDAVWCSPAIYGFSLQPLDKQRPDMMPSYLVAVCPLTAMKSYIWLQNIWRGWLLVVAVCLNWMGKLSVIIVQMGDYTEWIHIVKNGIPSCQMHTYSYRYVYKPVSSCTNH